MRPLRAITLATVRQVLGLRRAIIFGLAAMAPALVFLLTSQALIDEAALDRFLGMIVGLYFPLLVPIVALIISASALGDERRDGTLSFLVLRPIPRTVISGSKFLGGLLVASGLNALGGGALGIVYAIETGSWDVVLPLVAGGIVATTVYASLFVPLGFFTDRAVLVGLAFVFIFENGVVSALSGLSSLSPWRLGMSAFSGLAPGDVTTQLADIGIANLSGLGSTMFRTVVIAALSIAATTLVLRRRDLA
ncbi:MAG: ABC transporter permease subunit [Actinomycetota bacterium]|nr:ABC transporter permease subunit [Actinomycetota bacterium]